ncbi:MAG: TMEM175 family protein [Bacteroidota bacterium]
MLRRALFARSARREQEDAFVWRGEGVSRLENLSDIVFAFAVSFLVAGSAPPRTFNELAEVMVDFVAVGFCFALLLFVWYIHYLFFRRYGLEDGRTIVLNGVLLFLILLYVYPLRFLIGFQADLFFGRLSGPAIAEVLTFEQAPWLSLVYSGGYAAVFALFALLYRHALTKADELDLSEAERIMTRQRVTFGWVHVGVSLGVIVLGFLLPVRLSPLAGSLYFLLGPLLVLAGRPYKRKLEHLTGATE